MAADAVAAGSFPRAWSRYVDTTDPAAVESSFRADTKALVLESPSNPMLKISDLKKIAQLCRERGVLSVVDNTLLTPYLQRPLELGCDLVVHSATKYLGGHNDLLAGVVVAGNEQLAQEVAFVQNASGPVLAPHECWLSTFKYFSDADFQPGKKI